nr:MAG TPA: Cyclin-dependent kinase inhibitor [Caudoviricetes sp.]
MILFVTQKYTKYLKWNYDFSIMYKPPQQNSATLT